jgi:hypothetical protein
MDEARGGEGFSYRLDVLVHIVAPCGEVDADRSHFDLHLLQPDGRGERLIEEPLRGTCDAIGDTVICLIEASLLIEDEDSTETQEFDIAGTCEGIVGEETATCSTDIPGLDLGAIEMISTRGVLQNHDIDADDDGYELCVDDCDDEDATVYPGNGC